MLYDIRMEITYRYPVPATGGRHVLRLMPAEIPGLQHLVSGSISVQPSPGEWLSGRDFFGNATEQIALDSPHAETVFDLAAQVERQRDGGLLDVSPRLPDLASELASHVTLGPDAPHHFLGDSPRIALHPEMTAYGAEIARDGGSVFEIIRALGRRIHDEFTFDPEATEVDTPTYEAFRRREGVCQDFTHVMIACLRGLGIPAGYVSGFLRTIPPPGQPRLEGADAMHAWVRAWCGHQMGWVEYDPTNALQVAGDHVVVAHGRDYSDVAPVKGMMRLAGEQDTSQKVDVLPLE